MEPLTIIKKYYKENSDLYNILVRHSTDVMNKAVAIAQMHPELNVNVQFLKEAAMLHDIGIFLTNAPSILCFGVAPYICHGYLGREILDREGYPHHALVCERHTGTGLTMEDIIAQNLPLPRRDLCPISIEEKIICFADCFFSKTNLDKEKTIDEIRASLTKHNKASLPQLRNGAWIFYKKRKV